MSAQTAIRMLVRASLVAGLAAATLQATPVMAAPDSPVILTPSGQSGPAVEISWEPVAGATSYEAKVDEDSSFGSPEWTSSTPNTVSVPNRLFSVGTQWVEVRAKVGSEWSDWAVSNFTVTKRSAPELTSPDDGAHLANPEEPPLLSWLPVAGAKSYVVEVDTEDGFVGATSYTTQSNAFVLTDSQAPHMTYYWRVQAVLANGVLTDPSEARTYSVQPIATPTTTAPDYDQDITDVVLDWDPVPGAKHYELQVDDDINFGSPLSVPSKIYSTRYSPATTFGNGQYYWRVRAIDLDDNPTQWVQHTSDSAYFFDRVWRDQPQLVHPYDASANGAVAEVQNDLYFEWTPVPHASNYELWLSPDPNFTEPTNSTVQCVVAGTTYTPGEHGDPCMPGAEGGVYYWKVLPMDRPYDSAGVEGIFSKVQAFTYTDQDFISISTPSTVAFPTLDWSPVPGTDLYEIELYQGNTRQLKTKTASTSYTPLNVYLDPANGTDLRWTIRTLDNEGRTSLIAQRSFTWNPTLLDTSTPLELRSGQPTYDAPDLRWGAVAGATYYRIDIADAATGYPYADSTAPILGARLYFPAATDTGLKFLNAGTYQWWITAYDANDDPLTGSGMGTFEVRPLGPVTGQRLALTGSALNRGEACTETLSDGESHVCDGVIATPVLDWDTVPYASEYRVWISRDPDFTSGLLDVARHTVNTRWTPRSTYDYLALQESQANKAYYWFIQPCKSESQCGPSPASNVNQARHAFRKTSPAVEGLSPADGATVQDTEITFSWEDYYDTNQEVTYAATGERGYQSARQYRVQVSDQPTFSNLLDNVVVDQPTYTAADRLYPDGPLYWRVQAIDAHGNALTWSTSHVLQKASARPRLLSPLQSAGEIPSVSGSVPFEWEAQAFAGTYDIQVAANDDVNFSAANLRVSRSSKRSAFTTGGSTVNMLQASDTPYVWRVRRRDPKGNVGPWSEIGRFRVVLPHPDLLSPAPDAVVGPRGLVLRWTPVADAANYLVELRKGAGSPIKVTTPTVSHAPTLALVVGSAYSWRVTPINQNGQSPAAGEWRYFTVGGAPQASVAASIEGSGVLGTTLTAVDPTWTVPGVDNTYQWQRNGVAIEGATSSTHDVTVADVEQAITVLVTGTAAEFGTGQSTSAAVRGLPGEGPVALTDTQISGSGQVGSLLTSTLPTWDPEETVVGLQWKRNGTAITGATNETYQVQPADLNTDLTLTVTGTLPGRTPTESVSNTIGTAAGVAPKATSTPAIQGTPRVGQRLSSVAPTWDVPNVTHKIEWLRDGSPIAYATLTSYVVQAEDVGAQLTVRYTGTAYGYADGVAVSAPVVGLSGDTTPTPTPTPTPGPAPTPTPGPNPGPNPGTIPTPTPPPADSVASSTKLKAPTAKSGKRARVTITVKVSGVASPVGVVNVYAGKKLVAKIKLKAGKKGKATARLKKLKKGSYKLHAVYLGTGGVTASTSKTVVLKVR